jgi:hypothetical protein
VAPEFIDENIVWVSRSSGIGVQSVSVATPARPERNGERHAHDAESVPRADADVAMGEFARR